jgi:hypothetical protein
MMVRRDSCYHFAFRVSLPALTSEFPCRCFLSVPSFDHGSMYVFVSHGHGYCLQVAARSRVARPRTVWCRAAPMLELLRRRCHRRPKGWYPSLSRRLSSNANKCRARWL